MPKAFYPNIVPGQVEALTGDIERDVRQLRDKVYGVSTKDDNWRYCRDYWMRPDSVRWLKEKSQIPLHG